MSCRMIALGFFSLVAGVIMSPATGRAQVGGLRAGGPQQPSVLRGTVYDHHGQPQPGVSLLVNQGRGGAAGMRRGQSLAPPIVSDARGEFIAQNLTGTVFGLTLSRTGPDSPGVLSRRIMIQSGQERVADLGGSAKLSGKLLLNGVPLKNGRVLIGSSSPMMTEFRALAETNDDGRFDFFGILPGRRSVYCSLGANDRNWMLVGLIDVLSEGGDLGELHLRTGNVRVEVQGGADLNAVALQRIFNGRVGRPDGNLSVRPSLVESEKQAVVYSIVPLGRYEVNVRTAPQISWTRSIELTPDQPNAHVVLGPSAGTAVLEGKITDMPSNSRSSLMGFELSNDNRSLVILVPAQNDGTFRQDSLPPGEYFLRHMMPVGLPPIMRVQLKDGTAENVSLKAEQLLPFGASTGELAVETVTVEGDPIPCEISLTGPEGIVNPIIVQDARMSFLATTGAYRLTASFPGFEPVNREVTLVKSQPGTPNPNSTLQIVLTPAAITMTPEAR